jgi:nucleotide-binding universal stress UspA family protein
VLTQAIHEQAKRTLDRAIDSVPTGVAVEHRLLTGSPADVIAAATADRDLLIVGSRGYGPLRRTLLGGVSAGLARTAECPLLVLSRGAGGDPLRLGERDAAAAASP